MVSEGIIFNIQHFSIYDGPGIRTTVFFKGCPLRCQWCHNPESWFSSPQLGYTKSKCIHCGACVYVCQTGAHQIIGNEHCFNREKCVLCGMCIKVCSGALTWVGKKCSCAEIMEDIQKDEMFYKYSGGGITLSGGEPLIQYDLCKELLKECKRRGIHTAVETSGYIPWCFLENLADYIDLFLYDWKESNTDRHRQFTGQGNELIRDNLLRLDRISKDIILRCPIIPNYNFTKEHRNGIIDISQQLSNLREINIEPYHPLGISKADLVGECYRAVGAYVPKKEDLKDFADEIGRKIQIPIKII